MVLKRFTEKKYRSGKIGEPMVSVLKSGQISFNTPAMRQFELYDFDYAVLFFDKDTRTVGIMLTNDDGEDGAYKLIKRETGGYAVSAKKFLNFHDINYLKSKTYPVEYDENEKMYIFQLD